MVSGTYFWTIWYSLPTPNDKDRKRFEWFSQRRQLALPLSLTEPRQSAEKSQNFCRRWLYIGLFMLFQKYSTYCFDQPLAGGTIGEVWVKIARQSTALGRTDPDSQADILASPR